MKREHTILPPRILALFGATGQTGRQVIAAALDRGWQIRALVRPATALPDAPPAVQWIRGDFSSAETVATVMVGADAVCCVFGPRLPSPEIFCAAATRAVVGTIKQRGPRRLICVTGAMIGDYPRNRTLPFQCLRAMLVRRFPQVFADRAKQETVVRESGLDWTIVKPPRLTNGPAGGRVKAGTDLCVGLLSKVSRSDLAEFILNEIEQPQFSGQAVFVDA